MPILTVSHTVPIVVLYIGPDQIMPLTSLLGAAVGIALMFWNKLVYVVSRALAFLTRRDRAQAIEGKNLESQAANPGPRT